MCSRAKIEDILLDQHYTDFRWIGGTDVQVGQWVRFKCMFGCDSYGKKGTCPPAVPSIEECRALFCEYQHIVVIRLSARFEHPDERREWSRRKNLELLKLEKAVFLQGYPKAFLLFMDECRICADCPGERTECRNLKLARPSPEALGMDVFSTARKAGFPIQVLTDYHQEMNRYAFLLVE